MSYVTNVVVSARYVPHDAVGRLRSAYYMQVDGGAGGPKVYEAVLFARTFNFALPSEEILAEIGELIGDYSSSLIVIMHHQEDEDEVNAWHRPCRTDKWVALTPDNQQETQP